MAKQNWKPGNMLYPLPAVMVSCQSSTAHDPLCERPELDGKPNIITVAWAGTVCTNPPMVSISVRPERGTIHISPVLSHSPQFAAVVVVPQNLILGE